MTSAHQRSKCDIYTIGKLQKTVLSSQISGIFINQPEHVTLGKSTAETELRLPRSISLSKPGRTARNLKSPDISDV